MSRSASWAVAALILAGCSSSHEAEIERLRRENETLKGWVSQAEAGRHAAWQEIERLEADLEAMKREAGRPGQEAD